MSELPKGWVEAELGEVAVPRDEKVDPASMPGALFLGLEHIEAGTGRILSHGLTDSLKSQVALFEKGDLLFGRLRPYLQKIIVADNSGAASAEFIIFRDHKNGDTRFLKALMKSPDFLVHTARVSTGDRPRVSYQSISRFRFPLPPLAEQKRIVAKLDALSARSARARKELESIDALVARYKQAMLSKAFSGELTEENRINRISIGDVAAKITKGASPKWQGFNYQNEGIRFIRSQNVGWGRLRLDDQAFLDPEFNLKQANSIIEINDVLLNIVGASIGRTAVADDTIMGANCNQAVSVIKLTDKGPVSAKYLCWWLQTDEAQAAITAGAVDVARANFSLAQIKKLSLPWPSDQKKREIVRRIESAFGKIDRLAGEAKRALALVGRLDEAVLAKAFRGELVPQDPNDEPASVLLERIRAERAAAPKPKRRLRRAP
ncbi:restriction endonuclease subunit S [Stappia indica]|uniref:restriction endonuclease subunit S n=1 Tax=Stappia indica TaxID=538381 RepID=UPI000836FE8C|nr:restriction endonuclease subunit S [Stappia indica]